jgi:hypothetical protein
LPAETSATFQILPTALSLILALVLLVWYATLQRQSRVAADLDRLDAIIVGGAPPPGRSVAEGACLGVQRIESEVAPITTVLSTIGSAARGVLEVPVAWIDAQTKTALRSWLEIARVRDIAHELCAGVRFAARAVATDGTAVRADTEASQASFGRALAVLESLPVGAANGLGRVGVRSEALRSAILTYRLDAASLTALAIAAGQTEAGNGRGATYLLVVRAHPPALSAALPRERGEARSDEAPDAVAIARVTIRDGAIVECRVDSAAAWEAGGATLPAPTGLVSADADAGWHLADFDWWLDFRRDAAQFLVMWQASGQDASQIDGIVAVDLAAFTFNREVKATGDGAALAQHVDEVLRGMASSRVETGALLSALERAARDGLAVAWMREPAVQSVVEARGWAGLPVVPSADHVAVVRRALRGPRSHIVQDVGPVASGVRVDGVSSRARLVVAATVPIGAVHGAIGPVESIRVGDAVILEVPVARDESTVLMPIR